MKKNFLVLGIALLALLPAQKASTIDNTQFWLKIRALDKFERSIIANTGVSIEIVRDDFVIATGNLEEKNQIEKMGKLESSYPLDSNMFDFPSEDSDFHNYTRLNNDLAALQQAHPKIMQLGSIGRSTEGREITLVRISNDLANASKKPGIIYMGGHHAREHVSVEIPFLLVKYLVEEYDKGNQRIVNLVNSRDIHIIPAVNPDGLEYDVATGSYQMWRKNRRVNENGTYGVDLNRNYGYGWGTGGSSTNPNSDTYMGPAPFSEPETQAVKNYLEHNVNITTLLSFHTYSELILYPWGGKSTGIENEKAKAVHVTMAERMAQWNNYTAEQASDLYIASGDTCDWAFGQLGIISFTFELDPRDSWGGAGFYPGEKIIPEVFRKNLEPALYLLEYSDNPYRVIDHNPVYNF